MTTISYITELGNNNYQTFVTGNKLVLIDVHTSWCQPCRQIAPIVDELSVDYLGKLSVGKLDADKNSEITTELGIRSIPTLLIYKDGEIVERLVGLQSKSKLKEKIENLL